MHRAAVACLCFLSLSSFGQTQRIVIPAGTPEDQALQTISSETDAQKKIAMYEDFAQKFSSNPAAAAYGDWQISQAYQTAGDLDKALSYGDKALAAMPNNFDILVSQTNIAQQMKSDSRVVDYATRGGAAYNGESQAPRPEGLNDEQFAARIAETKERNKSSYEFLEAAAFNAITDEKDAKARMGYIDRFTPAFPDSHFQEQVTQFAMYSLGQMNETSRMYAYGEKVLATNPNSVPTLLLLANAYVEDTHPGSVAKSIAYSEKVIALAKVDAPADHAAKMSAGVAHSTLAYAYMKQEKIAPAIPELKAAATLLKGQDDAAYAIVLYRLGFAYGKTGKLAEARAALEEGVKIPGPMQPQSAKLLADINAMKTKAR